jgi:cysteine desulfurase / selenocysteine lyase
MRWDTVRNDFPILHQMVRGHPLVYLDNAATTQKPLHVIEALCRYYESDNANVHRGLHELSHRATVAYEAARDKVATFLNARRREEIIFTRGATEAINLVARSWGDANIKPGDTILLTEMEHHSNLVPWQMLAERRGARIAYLPVTGFDGLLNLDSLDRILRDSVKLLAFTHVSNVFGTVNPVIELVRRARHHGITTLIDAAQSAGHMPVDLAELDCDFLVCSGHKMAGPTGIGVLFGRFEILEKMAPFHGGGEMIDQVTFDRTTFKLPPMRFEAGTPPIAGAIGLAAAIEYIEALGRDMIARHDASLGALARRGLSEIRGVRLLGPALGGTGVVSFAIDDVHAHDLVTYADQAGIALRGGHHCTMPLHKKLGLASSSRASFYVYNTHAEVERFLECVEDAIGFFGGR